MTNKTLHQKSKKIWLEECANCGYAHWNTSMCFAERTYDE